MKLLWQHKFENLDLVKTSPLYYRGAAVKEDVLNCFFFDAGLGITEISFDVQNGQILAWGKSGNTKAYKESYGAKQDPLQFCIVFKCEQSGIHIFA